MPNVKTKPNSGATRDTLHWAYTTHFREKEKERLTCNYTQNASQGQVSGGKNKFSK